MHFGVEQAHDHGVAVVRVTGELDVSTLPALAEATSAQLASSPRALLVDLTATTFLDSSGARHLARTARTAADRGTALQVLCPRENRPVRRTIDLLDLHAAVDVVERTSFLGGQAEA